MMDYHTNYHQPAPRQPLGDATQRLNHGHVAQANHSSPTDDIENNYALKGHPAFRGHSAPAITINPATSEPNSHGRKQYVVDGADTHTNPGTGHVPVPVPVPMVPIPANPRMAAVAQELQPGADARRVSQFSNVSSNASTTRQLKTHIGPWQLGKTLGKGSSARVRLARHRVTHQLVAVKIVAKATVRLTQGDSLANLDMIDYRNPTTGPENGIRRMPMAIEREVAILKLIRHPNIIELIDIWENRSEIYLVTEYVEKGDLFNFINWNGALREEEAIFYFRQIMTALEYCHRFNICHRDLKPENILLKGNGQIKIADFGLAALQQDRNHQLRTACGSPHYAAPEILRHQFYKGPAVDIWSMGVILYAMLAGHLPFDDENMEIMMQKAKRAEYRMPAHLSKEARDLIRRILVEQPAHRITMNQMWRHALIKKYDYLEEWYQWESPSRSLLNKIDTTAVPVEIDAQILRQLKALWHNYPESTLEEMLKDEKPNDQKLFYWLLWCHREEQLENYNNNIPISKSDFHHLKPPNWGKRISTCQFTNPGRKGHTRSFSRFTVISNVKDSDDAETVHSYDPYNASRVLQPCSSQITSAKIIIHRDTPEPSERSQSRLAVSHSYRSYQSVNGSFRQRARAGSRRTSISGTLQSPQLSVSSIRSHQSNPRVRANNKGKRGVDFSSVRSRAQRHRRNRHTMAAPSTSGSPTVDDRETASCPGDNDRGQVDRSMMDVSQANESAFIWTEELEQLHDRIARDCDEAFRSSLLTEVETAGGASREASPFAISLNGLPIYKDSDKGSRSVSQSTHPYDSRPLPPVPDRSPVTPISPVSPMSIDHHGIRVDSVSPPSRPSTAHGCADAPATDRRIVSDSAYNHQGQKDPRALPSIQEASPYNWMHRDAASTRYDADASALETPTRVKNKGLDYLARAENTIRVVNSPSTMVPAPLNVRKVSRKVTPSEVNTTTHSPIEFWAKDVPPYASSREEPRQHQTIGTEQVTSKKRVSSWFRRVHKDNGSATSIATVTDSSGHNKSDLDGVFSKRSVSDSTAPSSNDQRLEKKKSFGFGFFKLGKNQPKMYIGGDNDDEPNSSRPDLLASIRPRSQQRASGITTATAQSSSVWSDSETGGYGAPARKIEVQQNWLARLFRVKPATRYLCFAMPKRRARQELAILLREWRKYGMRDVEVDKERNIIFARVGLRNYLDLKEVSFAVEIMTVIEHGKRSPLSIARFTQEKGAASSFHRVVLAVKAAFKTRGLLVADKRKADMMIKTLNS